MKITLNWNGGELSFPTYVGGFPKCKRGRILLKTQAHLGAIDLIPDTAPYAGQTFFGIYELDQGILKASFAFPNNQRPGAFTAAQGQVDEIWQPL
jgi:uncharacterized protein (TIGR03067 family)